MEKNWGDTPSATLKFVDFDFRSPETCFNVQNLLK